MAKLGRRLCQTSSSAAACTLLSRWCPKETRYGEGAELPRSLFIHVRLRKHEIEGVLREGGDRCPLGATGRRPVLAGGGEHLLVREGGCLFTARLVSIRSCADTFQASAREASVRGGAVPPPHSSFATALGRRDEPSTTYGRPMATLGVP